MQKRVGSTVNRIPSLHLPSVCLDDRSQEDTDTLVSFVQSLKFFQVRKPEFGDRITMTNVLLLTECSTFSCLHCILGPESRHSGKALQAHEIRDICTRPHHLPTRRPWRYVLHHSVWLRLDSYQATTATTGAERRPRDCCTVSPSFEFGILLFGLDVM
jgi:hypothetical protein